MLSIDFVFISLWHPESLSVLPDSSPRGPWLSQSRWWFTAVGEHSGGPQVISRLMRPQCFSSSPGSVFHTAFQLSLNPDISSVPHAYEYQLPKDLF